MIAYYSTFASKVVNIKGWTLYNNFKYFLIIISYNYKILFNLNFVPNTFAVKIGNLNFFKIQNFCRDS